MKKTKLLILILLLFFTFGVVLTGCGNDQNPEDDNNGKDEDNNQEPEEDENLPLIKHLIVDQNGNYGGTLNRSKYGYGAPLNGEKDIENSIYYPVNDYYNMNSSSTRLIYKHFAPYQQTMQDSGGIACALMVLNYLGEDVQSKYTELNLVNTYENLNGTQVYRNGTTANGLVKVFKDAGYTSYLANYKETGSNTGEKISNFNSWIKKQLLESKFVFVRFQDGISFDWHVIIGYDDMGTDYPKDDVIVFADPYDNLDHYQDGYYTSASGRFYRWWCNVSPSGVVTDSFDAFIVEAKEPISFTIKDKAPVQVQTVPERHLLLNADGSFGGSTDKSLYGEIPEKNGETDHLTSNYHAFVDYYNMTSNETRYILPHYQAFQQTMASSCGICSTLSVLNYYGIDVETYNELYLVNKYCEVNDKATIYNVGVGSSGLKKLVATFGFNSEAASYARDSFVDSETSMIFPTFDKFSEWVINNLKSNIPMPVSWRPQNGHWEVIIGYDTMGTEETYDDVIVLADSHDTWDHYQDGYNTIPAHMFYKQWYNGSYTYNQQYNIFPNIK